MHKKALLAKCQIAAKILKLLPLIIIIIFCSDIRPHYFPNCDTDSRLPPQGKLGGVCGPLSTPPPQYPTIDEPNTQPLLPKTFC